MTVSRSNLPHPTFGGTVSAMVYNPLVMPGKHEVRAVFTIAGGQVLKAGSVLGAITTAGATQGHMVLSLAAAGDGSQVPRAVLAEDLDTTLNGNADKNYSVYVEGMFNETALVFGAGHSANSVRMDLRDRGIYLSAPRYSYLP